MTSAGNDQTNADWNKEQIDINTIEHRRLTQALKDAFEQKSGDVDDLEKERRRIAGILKQLGVTEVDGVPLDAAA